jgi:hypothetical protein
MTVTSRNPLSRENPSSSGTAATVNRPGERP